MKVETAISLCAQLTKNYPDVEWISALVNATLSMKENNVEKAVNILLECSKKDKEHRTVMLLSVAQLLIIEVILPIFHVLYALKLNFNLIEFPAVYVIVVMM